MVRGKRVEYEEQAVNIVQMPEREEEPLDMTPYLILFGSVLSFVILGMIKGVQILYRRILK